MRIKDVVTLKEVVSDLNDGKAFYDQRETGGIFRINPRLMKTVEPLS